MLALLLLLRRVWDCRMGSDLCRQCSAPGWPWTAAACPAGQAAIFDPSTSSGSAGPDARIHQTTTPRRAREPDTCTAALQTSICSRLDCRTRPGPVPRRPEQAIPSPFATAPAIKPGGGHTGRWPLCRHVTGYGAPVLLASRIGACLGAGARKAHIVRWCVTEDRAPYRTGCFEIRDIDRAGEL